MSEEHPDGRRARGERRRSALIAATLRVVERDGVAGVAHRAAALEAGVSASSATYYLATLDDLLVAALTAAVEDYVHQLREIVDGGRDEIEGLAQLIVDTAGPGRMRCLAEQELTLLAVRRPVLRPAARRWPETVAEIAGHHTEDPLAMWEMVAVTEGLCSSLLLQDGSPSVPEVVGTVATRFSDGFSKLVPSAIAVAGVVGAYVLMSFALKRGMSLGVAYGTWAAVGVALVALIGSLALGDRLTLIQGGGIVLVMGGVLAMELGAVH